MYECFHCLNKSVCCECDYSRVPITEEDINELEEYNVLTPETEI